MTITYSLIIPHFNDPARLERLLRTVPVARDDVEIIVVDDCSPQQGVLDAVRVRWPWVRWLSTPENAGAGFARNVGLDAANGRWIVFADSDDEFLPEAFEAFDRVLRPDDELVYFLAEAVQEIDGSPSIRTEGINELVMAYADVRDVVSLQNLRLGHVVPWAKVYARRFVQAHQLRFDPVRRGNDVAFNVLAAVQAERLRAEVVPVYRVYRRPESLTADVSAAAFMERFLTDLSLAQRLEGLGVPRRTSATGHMLLSLHYGMRIMVRVWWLAIWSPMQIEWLRFFDLVRWRRFVTNHRRHTQERER